MTDPRRVDEFRELGNAKAMDNDGQEGRPDADGTSTDATYRCPTCGGPPDGMDAMEAWCSQGHRHHYASWDAAAGAKGPTEATIQRRSFGTRVDVNRKAGRLMDVKRRRIAQTAKRWRSQNKSRVKGYQSVYNRPKSPMHQESAPGAAAAAWLVESMLDEARNRAALDAIFERLSRSPGWVGEGWDRTRIVAEVDPGFIHHAEHYDRMLNGGRTRNGFKYRGGGGLRWGGLDIGESEALLRVMGSLEWTSDQDIYQQTIRFANWRRIAEAEGLGWDDKARLLLTRDNLRVHCDCASYRFFHARAATTKGFALIPEHQPALHNNPEDRGGVCKHLHLALKFLGAQSARMASEMKSHYEGRGG